MKKLFLPLLLIPIVAFADTNIFTVTNTTNWSIIYTNNIIWKTNEYKPFGYVQNIKKNYDFYGIDYSKPTNVEFIFHHEPIIIKSTNGTWLIHFKD